MTWFILPPPEGTSSHNLIWSADDHPEAIFESGVYVDALRETMRLDGLVAPEDRLQLYEEAAKRCGT